MKKHVFILATIIFSLLLSMAHAQKNKQHTLDSLFLKNTEVYFTFQIFDRSEIEVLTRIISIDNVKGKEVFAYANKKEFARFLDMGYAFTVLQHPGTLIRESELNMGGGQKTPKNSKNTQTVWNFYPTYDQYVSYMQGFAANHPEICRLDTIGYTMEGRLLLAVKLSDNVNVNRGKPEFLYTSSMHGDETTGYILMLHLIDSLLTSYGTVSRITNLLNNFQIYINPLANPDGTYTGGNNTVYGAQRANANGVDLNRNYPDPAAGPHPDGNAWQPETKAFMHYDTIHHFVMSANFHGGSEVVNYPWDTWSRLHADDAWMQFTSREYIDTVHHHSVSGYMTDLNNGITNGYAWYTITGGRQDYTTYFHYGREVTIEISTVKTLPVSQLINYWNYNKRSFLNYIEECAYGINGQVTDTVTGAPLNAKIMIAGHDIDNSFEYSNGTSGWYYRPIAQGNWVLTFTCSGYRPKTISGISVTNHNTTRLNVQMVPITYGIPGASQQFPVLIYPNPSDGNMQLLFPGSVSGSINYSVFDLAGRALQSGTFERAGDKSEYSLDLTRLQKGIYLLKLDDGNQIRSNKIEIK